MCLSVRADLLFQKSVSVHVNLFALLLHLFWPKWNIQICRSVSFPPCVEAFGFVPVACGFLQPLPGAFLPPIFAPKRQDNVPDAHTAPGSVSLLGSWKVSGDRYLRVWLQAFICLVASSFLSAKEYTNLPVCIVSPLRGSIWLRSGSLWRSSAPSRCVFTPYLCTQAAGQCSRCAHRPRFRLSFGQLEGIGRPIPAGLVTGRSIPNPSRTDSY